AVWHVFLAFLCCRRRPFWIFPLASGLDRSPDYRRDLQRRRLPNQKPAFVRLNPRNHEYATWLLDTAESAVGILVGQHLLAGGHRSHLTSQHERSKIASQRNLRLLRSPRW